MWVVDGQVHGDAGNQISGPAPPDLERDPGRQIDLGYDVLVVHGLERFFGCAVGYSCKLTRFEEISRDDNAVVVFHIAKLFKSVVLLL